MYDSLHQFEYEILIFKFDSMNDSFNQEEFLLYSDIFEHVDSYVYSEHFVEMVPSLYIHYEHENVDFVLPSELIEDTNLIGETDESDILSLPHENQNGNQVYDRGKKFC